MSDNLNHIREIINSSPETARDELCGAIDLVEQIQEQVIRKLSHELHPGIIAAGLRASIKSLRDTHERAVPIELDVAADVVRLEPDQGSTIPFETRLGLYRMASEALGNVVKHAKAKSVSVRLWLDCSVLCLTVEDDGRGFEAGSSKSGLGLTTMEDYMSALGGCLCVDSAPGRGTRITARVPVEGHTGGLAPDQPEPVL